MKGAAGSLQSDKAFVMECAIKAPEAFKYASDELRYDKSFVTDAVSRNGLIIQHVPFLYQADRDVARVAMDSNPSAAVFVHTSARADMDVRLPWDSEVGHMAEKNRQDSLGVGGKYVDPARPVMAGLPLTKEDAQAQGVNFWKKPKTQKIVQFSALSTM